MTRYEAARTQELMTQKKTLVEYLNAKVNAEDWHAVMDVAVDIREIEAKISMIKELDLHQGE